MTRHSIRWFAIWLHCLLLGLTLLLGDARTAAAQKAEAPPAASAKPRDFDKIGPQVGEQVPDLRLHTLKGEEQRLGNAWRGGPALLVTSSLTCPKSRSRWPELRELVEKYQDKINVVIVYVIEAHPVGSVCPYKDVEDITPENQRDGILREQPKTLEERLELAAEFKRLLRISTPMYVDNIKDEAWKGLGGAPNLALLIDQEGHVVARSGWFEGKVTKEAIDKYLQAKDKADQVNAQPRQTRNAAWEDIKEIEQQLKQAGFEIHGLQWIFRDLKNTDLEKMLKVAPQLAKVVLPSQQGHPYEATMLMEAAKNANAEAVKILLEHGADPKASTDSYESVMQIAAEVGDVAIGKLLLEKGADAAFPATGESPLHEAALNGRTEFVKLLLGTGLRHDLYSAIALGEIDLVRKGLAVDPSRALRPDGAKRMPMDYAAENGQLEIAKLLLAHGAPVVRDSLLSLEPPLHRAIAREDLAMAKLLLDAGSSPDTSVGHRGESAASRPALHLAITKKNLGLVKLLLAHKVDLKLRDTYSQTALHDAAALGQTEIAAALIAAGADVNALQLGYDLPCGSGEEEIPSNTTPLHFAAASGNPETVKLLLAAGAKLDAVTKDGETPLMFAAKSRRYENDQEDSRLNNVEFLIAKGADVNAQDKQGQSILDIADSAYHGDDARSKQDHQEMLTLLKKHGAKPGKPKTEPAAPMPVAPADPFAADPFAEK